jgi:hypothetical protein
MMTLSAYKRDRPFVSFEVKVTKKQKENLRLADKNSQGQSIIYIKGWNLGM